MAILSRAICRRRTPRLKGSDTIRIPHRGRLRSRGTACECCSMIGENENATEYWSSITHLRTTSQPKPKLTTPPPAVANIYRRPAVRCARARASARMSGVSACFCACFRVCVRACERSGRAPLLVEQQHGLAVIVRHRHNHFAVPKLVAALRDDERVALRQNLTV